MSTYNGWTNYETWAVNLWMENDEGSYRYWRSEARAHGNVRDLARAMREEFDSNMPEVEGVWADLLGASLSEVNWDEIAGAWLGEESEE